MNTIAFFPYGGRVKFNLRDRWGNQIFFLKTPAAVKFFPQNCQKVAFWGKKIYYPLRCICITHIGSPILFPWEIIIFQGVLTK